MGGGSVGSSWPWISFIGGMAPRKAASICLVSAKDLASCLSYSVCQAVRSPCRAWEAAAWAASSSSVGSTPGVPAGGW